MKIIFLYIEIEHILKEMIKIAYDVSDECKNFYRIDNLKCFFKINLIDLNKIKNFKSINEIRLVNNRLKHNSGEINQEISEIFEFKNCKEFTQSNLNSFYSRVHLNVKPFFSDLVKTIIEQKNFKNE